VSNERIIHDITLLIQCKFCTQLDLPITAVDIKEDARPFVLIQQITTWTCNLFLCFIHKLINMGGNFLRGKGRDNTQPTSIALQGCAQGTEMAAVLYMKMAAT
jgi:hypothetical protein